MKTLDALIEELLELQRQGKGNYSVIDNEFAEPIEVMVFDESKKIIF